MKSLGFVGSLLIVLFVFYQALVVAIKKEHLNSNTIYYIVINLHKKLKAIIRIGKPIAAITAF